MLYSYKGEEPSLLPIRIRLDNGLVRTSLNELSSKELKFLGFVGPIIKPNFDKNTQKIEWNGGEYQVIELTKNEIVERELEKHRQKLENVNHNRFWQLLITSSVYKKLRTATLHSLTVNTLYTELIALFGDAKIGNPNSGMIQKYINILFLNFQFTEDEISELQDFMNQTNLDALYTLPDKEYISSYTYDIETNSIIEPSPFESWILVNGKWEAPVTYPTDGKIYNWNEEELNWIAIN
jgi:hypothetical protein